MWSRAHWLLAWVRVRGEKHVWIPPLFLSVHTVRGAVLSADGLLGLIPGSAGRAARAGQDALQKTLAVLQDEGLDVDVNVRLKHLKVRVLAKMV